MINVATAEILAMDSESVQDGIDGLLTATDNIAARLFGVDSKRAVTRATWLTADGRRVYQNGRKLSQEEVRDLMQGTDALGEYMKGMRKNRAGNIGLIIGASIVVGGFLINDEQHIGGLVGVLVGVPLGMILSIDNKRESKEWVEEAVDTYNSVINKRTRAELKFGFTQNGIGLALNF
jgi:hypothetical protein